MNPTEIADALEEIASRPFDGGEFAFAFAAAMGSPQATVSKLRSGTINKSKVPGAVAGSSLMRGGAETASDVTAAKLSMMGQSGLTEQTVS